MYKLLHTGERQFPIAKPNFCSKNSSSKLNFASHTHKRINYSMKSSKLIGKTLSESQFFIKCNKLSTGTFVNSDLISKLTSL